MVTLFLVVFGNEVTKILINSLFIFHFCLANGKCCTENHTTKVTICDEPGKNVYFVSFPLRKQNKKSKQCLEQESIRERLFVTEAVQLNFSLL